MMLHGGIMHHSQILPAISRNKMYFRPALQFIVCTRLILFADFFLQRAFKECLSFRILSRHSAMIKQNIRPGRHLPRLHIKQQAHIVGNHLHALLGRSIDQKCKIDIG